MGAACSCCSRARPSPRGPERASAPLLPPEPRRPPPRAADELLALPAPRALLPEYAAALARVCIAEPLLRASPLHALLARLGRLPPPPPPRLLLPALLRRAFGLPSDAAARAFTAALPLLELHAPVPLLPACVAFVAALRWEAAPLCAALQLQLQHCGASGSGGADGLVLAVGLMAQASTSCASRRRAAVASILFKAEPLLPAGGEGGEEEEGGGGAAVGRLAAALGVGAPAAAAAALRLRAAAAAWVQDLKDRAFDSVFLQPSRLLAAAAVPRLEYVLLDAEVHGAPTLAALLAAATGVRVSLAPELSDEATGFADAAAVKNSDLQRALGALWEVGAAGRSWESLKGCGGEWRVEEGAVADVFCGWRGSRVSGAVTDVRSFALQGADASAANAPSRRFFARHYLRAFARYLEAREVVPRLAAALLAGQGEDVAAVVAGAGGLLPGSGECGGGEGGGSSAGEWLYDMEAFPPVLREERAWALLELLGVVAAREGGGAAGEGEVEGEGAEEAAEAEWACPRCTCLNGAQLRVCQACEGAREEGSSAVQATG